MSIRFVSGNIFTYPGLDGICHGCNCQGIMGAGIAAEVRRRFPKMHEFYVTICKRGDFALGDIYVEIDQEVKNAGYDAIYNLATQYYTGPDANLNAIKKSVIFMLEDAKERGIKTIGVPRLGAGIGGLDWTDVKKVLIEASNYRPEVELIVFETFKP